MNIRELEAAVSAIEDSYILEAGETIGLQERTARKLPHRLPLRLPYGLPFRFPRRLPLRLPCGRPSRFSPGFTGGTGRKARIAAACLAGALFLCAFSLPAAVAAGSIPAYDLLHSLFPKTAERLTPVQLSCEDNGIRMETEAVYVYGDTAEIYLSLQDLTGSRIDETTDLFDSYSIRLSGSGSGIGTCSRISFDPETGKVFFLVQMQRTDGKEIEGRKVDFRVSGFLTGKQQIEAELTQITPERLEEKTRLQREAASRGSGGMDLEKVDEESRLGFLVPDAEQTFSPAEGVTVTAYGWVDGRLRVQVHYADILNTDNHGRVFLKDGDGNLISDFGSAAFWDEERSGSYQEYFFDVGPDQFTEEWSVWGDFTTCTSLLEGDWRVSFPAADRGGAAAFR